MNQKKAKKLRRTVTKIAELRSGLPTVKYILGCTPIYTPKRDDADNIIGYTKTKGIPTVLDENCTRFIYQQMKKAA